MRTPWSPRPGPARCNGAGAWACVPPPKLMPGSDLGNLRYGPSRAGPAPALRSHNPPTSKGDTLFPGPRSPAARAPLGPRSGRAGSASIAAQRPYLFR